MADSIVKQDPEHSKNSVPRRVPNWMLPLCFLVGSALFFLGYSYMRPHPGVFETFVFVLIVAMAFGGFSYLTRSVVEVKDGKLAAASGPIAAVLGSLIVLLPLFSSLAGATRHADGTCTIAGTWNCVACKFNKQAELYEVTSGGDVRDIEMRQALKTWSGRYMVEKGIVMIPNLQNKGQSVLGFVAPDCSRIDWSYLWVWQRYSSDPPKP